MGGTQHWYGPRSPLHSLTHGRSQHGALPRGPSDLLCYELCDIGHQEKWQLAETSRPNHSQNCSPSTSCPLR